MKNIDTLIVHPENAEQIKVLKEFMNEKKINYEVSSNSPYDPEFVRKIKESEKQIEEGKSVRVKKEDLKSLLGL